MHNVYAHVRMHEEHNKVSRQLQLAIEMQHNVAFAEEIINYRGRVRNLRDQQQRVPREHIPIEPGMEQMIQDYNRHLQAL